MKKILLTILIYIVIPARVLAQNTIKGIIKDYISEKPIHKVNITVNNNTYNTNENGIFLIKDLPNGKLMVMIKKEGYENQNYPVKLSGSTIDLGAIFMQKVQILEDQEISIITITDDELNDDANIADNISGLLQSSRDVYIKTAAFEWSPSFYKIRGLDSDNATLLINGVAMNKLDSGRPEWSNWGGLNDVLRNQEFSNGLAPSSFSFGGVLGATNIDTRASKYSKGTRISYASSNRSYRHRTMGTYASGILKDGWAFAVSASNRIGNKGFIDGTFYNANSFFASIEKIFNSNHSINLTSFITTNKRGGNSPNTQEVFDLKGIQYNPNWGYQNGNIRNAKVKEVSEPIFMLNHFWKPNKNIRSNTNISYQFGKIGRSRIDFNGGANPNPTQFRNLPSFWLAKDDLAKAYEAEQDFLNNGQINWNNIYTSNLTNNEQGINAAYVLYEDREDNNTLNINTILNATLNNRLLITGKIAYKNEVSSRFAHVLDVLGSTNGYLDVNGFGKIGTPERQNNLLNPDRIVNTGDTFKYNYQIHSSVIKAFTQVEVHLKNIDFYVAANVSSTSYQRKGLYQSGQFTNNSLGNSAQQGFLNFGAKSGLTYKISGRHLLDTNIGYLTKAPTIRNTFNQIRNSNLITDFLSSKLIFIADASYIARTPIVNAKITGYYAAINNDTETNFFFSQLAAAEAFVQETVTGIDKKHMGAELGIEFKITPSLQLKGAANFGHYIYSNNPSNVQFSTENTETTQNEGFDNGIKNFGKTYLKNYRLPTGPQKTYSVGFEYRDPEYWWISLTGNYFDDAFASVSPVMRSNALFTDSDGLPFNNFNTEEATEYLQQEKFDSYITANVIGGKSWRLGKTNKYIGFTLGISNILNKQYKTGGFEQARNGDFQSLLEDFNNPTRLFANKYWYGRGTNYFFNTYFKF
ncbi:Plug domain-containing protein [Tenacibaculum sp. M341]|uniref:Plug domain-containing protein n=1 Tax=Tenacibaculum sp. M341 TaxID=2530339 RepID=UPI00104C7D9F|nr:Plug domain-containing protein [Tenacibaculum sp. M341]TCI84495.1 TonB-dependent receptor [Tenacibaculum sp. M341]